MNRKAKCKLVMFDLDGTLLDTLADLAHATNGALQQLGFPAHPVDAYRYFVGDGVENLVKRALPEQNHTPDTIAACRTLMRAEYARRWADNTIPYPGVPELLTALTQRGIPMAVLSNKPDYFAVEMVAKFLGDWHFEIVRGALADVPIKPDPMAALEIVRRLHIEPAECLYLGDTCTDMRTAVNAGFYPIGATWGFRPAEELLESGAKALADYPTDVISLMNI
jgi:phosphoglycolate phosphatase